MQLRVLDDSIAKAESNKEGDPHYFTSLLKWTYKSKKDIEEAQKLEEKSDKELLKLYLSKESNILNTFNREYNAKWFFWHASRKTKRDFQKS
nr:hypothetical protein [Mycoplasmopsis bovis]